MQIDTLIDKRCQHKWREEICAPCNECGQRHNPDKCIICGAIRLVAIPCSPQKYDPAQGDYDVCLKKHYIRYIQQQFAFAANPIDEEEHAAMEAKLTQYRKEIAILTKPIATWKDFIAAEMQKDYFKALNKFLLEEERVGHTIYPPKKDIFRAFDLCPLNEVKCVVLGMDPYHGEGEAMGLSFSVPEGVKIPPSLRNIFTEIKSDLNTDHKFKSGDLTEWARQGVLLINSALTVRKGEAGSHSKSGWHEFSNAVIGLLDGLDRPMVVMLWGGHARMKKELIRSKKVLVLESSHPSPLSAHNGFFGNHHFSRANEYLVKNGMEPIRWLI